MTLSGPDPKQIFINCLLCTQPWLGLKRQELAPRSWPCLRKLPPNTMPAIVGSSRADGAGASKQGRLQPGWEPSWVISLLNGAAIGPARRPPLRHRGGRGHEVVWLLLQGSWHRLLPLPGVRPCGHRMQGQGAGEELSLPCAGTKAASGPGTQLGTSCWLAWPARQRQGAHGGEPEAWLSPGPKGSRRQRLLPQGAPEPWQQGHGVAGGAGGQVGALGPLDHGFRGAVQEDELGAEPHRQASAKLRGSAPR